MKQFIYVFTPEDKDKLLERGYKLLRDDKQQNLYVFKNESHLTFSDDDIAFVTSDVLTY